MKLPAKKVTGRLFEHPDSNHTALIISQSNSPDAADYYLRFALVLQGIEWPLLPAFVLDDWGKERPKLSQLQWIYENGDYFPRAEIFGFVQHPQEGWQETQIFVRDLELTSYWPVFIYRNRNESPAAGVRLQYIALENEGVLTAVGIKRPDSYEMPYKRSALKWVEVPAGIQNNAFWQQIKLIS